MTQFSNLLNEIKKELERAIREGNQEEGVQLARQVLEKGTSPVDLFSGGIEPILADIGQKFERLEIFLPELMVAADVLKSIHQQVIEPAIKDRADLESPKRKGKVVIGTCSGDIHDIGKNMVSLMLQVNGFEVFDLGVSVAVSTFIDQALEKDANIIAMSSLLTPSLPYMKDLLAFLEARGLRDRFKVVVGGGPVTPEWAESIGADAYGLNAVEAVSVCRHLMENEDRESRGG